MEWITLDESLEELWIRSRCRNYLAHEGFHTNVHLLHRSPTRVPSILSATSRQCGAQEFIQKRAIANFAAADADYGRLIAEKVGFGFLLRPSRTSLVGLRLLTCPCIAIRR